jgi:VanZ family protein
MMVIFGLSSIAHPPPLPEGTDKDVHSLLYAGLGVLLVRALAGGWRGRVTLTIALATTALAGLYGITDEFHQSFVPPRQVEALDVVADTIGGGTAAFVLFAVDAFRRRRARPDLSRESPEDAP